LTLEGLQGEAPVYNSSLKELLIPVADAFTSIATNLSGTNTGDNATNSQYSGLATSKEDASNKSTSTGDSASSVKFPVWSAVVTYVTGLGYLLASTAASTYQAILTATNFGSFINGLTAKTTPVAADGVVLMDSADSNKAKFLSWANLKLGIGIVAKLRMTGDQSTTSNAWSDITDLVFSLEANTNYTIHGNIIIGCNNTGGVDLTATVPSLSTMKLVFPSIRVNNLSFGSIITDQTGNITSNTMVLANYVGYATVFGTISTGANAGNLQFRFRSGTNTQTSTVYKSGTFINIEK